MEVSLEYSRRFNTSVRSIRNPWVEPIDKSRHWVVLEARHDLAVAVPVKVPELASRLARVVHRAAARQHQAERAGLEARRDSGEPRALVPVAPDVGDDRLVEASEQVVSGVLAASLGERRVALFRQLLRLVARHLVDRLGAVGRHGQRLVEPNAVQPPKPLSFFQGGLDDPVSQTQHEQPGCVRQSERSNRGRLVLFGELERVQLDT